MSTHASLPATDCRLQQRPRLVLLELPHRVRAALGLLEAYDRGWFPRNVSDYKALEKLDVCGDEPPNLQPTATNTVTHGGIYGGVVEKPWLVHNWLPLTVGVVGGLIIAAVAIYVSGKMGAPPTTEPDAVCGDARTLSSWDGRELRD